MLNSFLPKNAFSQAKKNTLLVKNKKKLLVHFFHVKQIFNGKKVFILVKSLYSI